MLDLVEKPVSLLLSIFCHTKSEVGLVPSNC